MTGGKKFLNTPKQREIMKILVEAAARGEIMNLILLKSRLSYGDKVSDSALGCSLKFLAKHNFLTKKLHGAKPMEIMPTQLGFRRFKINEHPEPYL
jgi:hypothetical protein